MREILFKAKRIDNGEWVEGCLVTRKYYGTDKVFEAHIVIDAYEQFGIMNFGGQPVLISPVTKDDFEEGCFRVDTNTICQYTGLTDKNGNKIWENDIMKFVWGGKECIDVIEYQEPIFTYSNNFRWSLYEDEVIGNIFDNPELLEN